MKHTNKKGQVMQDIGALGIGIAALVIILAVTFLIMAQLKTQTITQATGTAVANETIAAWEPAVAFDLATECMGVSCSTLYNESQHLQTVPTTAWSCEVQGETNPQITITNTTHHIQTTTYLVYSCKLPSDAFNATNTLTAATATLPGWVPLIVLVIIGGIILGLVSAFKRR